MLNPPIKKPNNLKFIPNKDIHQKNKIILIKNIKNMKMNNNSKKYYKKNIYSSLSSKSDVLSKFTNEKYNNINKEELIKYNKHFEEKQSKNIYSDYELNELEYEKAKKLDKRSLCQTYYATLKREHLIFFTFFNCEDYNLLAVKVSRCIFLVVSDMALNSFFFSDDSMHKLFLTSGKYDFIQQIPQIIYSTIISSLIEIFICYLSLTDKYIYLLKKILIKGNIKNIKYIIRCIRIKLIIYFIFIFIFFIIYWYIISVFCGVYRNTQIAFIKDSSISFLASLVYPFVLYFVSACLRIWALRSSKKGCKCLYKFSFAVPLF